MLTGAQRETRAVPPAPQRPALTWSPPAESVGCDMANENESSCLACGRELSQELRADPALMEAEGWRMFFGQLMCGACRTAPIPQLDGGSDE